MANYSLADIKALRETTGAGMLDVKKALVEAEGDPAKALEIIRVKGLKGVGKREGRSASDGLVVAHVGPTADGEGQTGVKRGHMYRGGRRKLRGDLRGDALLNEAP